MVNLPVLQHLRARFHDALVHQDEGEPVEIPLTGDDLLVINEILSEEVIRRVQANDPHFVPDPNIAHYLPHGTWQPDANPKLGRFQMWVHVEHDYIVYEDGAQVREKLLPVAPWTEKK